MIRRWLQVWAATMALPAGAAWGEEPPVPLQAQQPTPPLYLPVAIPAVAILHSGATVTVRIRQVFPCDGLSPGDRLLNGRPEIQPGDRFLAELINQPLFPPPLVGGTVVKVIPPGR